MVGSDDERDTRTAEQTRRRRHSRVFLAAGAAVALTVAGYLTWEYGQVPERIAKFRGENCGLGYDNMSAFLDPTAGTGHPHVSDLREDFVPFEDADFSALERDGEFSGYLDDYDFAPGELHDLLEDFGDHIDAEPSLAFIDPYFDERPDEPAIQGVNDLWLPTGEPGDDAGNLLIQQDRDSLVLGAQQMWETKPHIDSPGGTLSLPDERRSEVGRTYNWELLSFDLGTGEQIDCVPLWEDSHEHRGGNYATFTEPVDDEHALIGTSSGADTDDLAAELSLVSVESGDALWERQSPLPPAPNPVNGDQYRQVVGDEFAVLSNAPGYYREGHVFDTVHEGTPEQLQSVAVDLNDGSTLWEYPANTAEEPELGFPVAEVPRPGEDLAVLMARGTPFSQDERPEDCGVCPMSWSLELVERDGEVVWSADIGEQGTLRSPWTERDLTVTENAVLYQDGETDSLRGFSLEDGSELWEVEMDEPYVLHSATEVDGRVVLPASSGTASTPYITLDPEAGEHEPLDGPPESSLSPLTDDTLLLTANFDNSRGGTVFVLYER